METITTAKDIASTDLFYIDGLASVREALEIMKSKGLSA